MKTNLQALARAVAEIGATLPREQLSFLADAAVSLSAEGTSRQSKALPRMVQRMLRRYGATPVTIDVPTALSSRERQEFTELLTKLLKRPVTVDIVENPSLIGGVRVKISDERFDFSLRGALNQIPAAFSSLHS